MVKKLQKLLKVSEVAKTLAVSERTVFRLAGAGELPGLKVRGCLRFQQSAIEAYQQNQIRKWILENGFFDDE